MICKKCGNDKGNDFRKHRFVCRECDNKTARNNWEKLKLKKKPDFIICVKCEKTTSDFNINRKKCNDCIREYGRNYRQQKPEKAKTWSDNNKEKHKDLQNKWYIENKEIIRDKEIQKYKNDIDYKYIKNHRTYVRSLYVNEKKHEYKKNKSYIDCSKTLFIKWISYQTNIKIQNAELDHVIPCYTYKIKLFDKEIVFTWMNIRIIDKQKNMKKNKYLNIKDLEEHREILHKFCTENNIENNKYMDLLDKLTKNEDYFSSVVDLL